MCTHMNLFVCLFVYSYFDVSLFEFSNNTQAVYLTRELIVPERAVFAKPSETW